MFRKIILLVSTSINKALEKNLLNLIIFLVGLSATFIFLLSVILFSVDFFFLNSNDSIFTNILLIATQSVFDQNAIFDVDALSNNKVFSITFQVIFTLFGILFFSAVIGIITNYISNKIELLREGKGRVNDEDHIIIFNFSRRLMPLLNELFKAYEGEKKSLVIVCNEPPVTAREKITSVLDIPKNISLLVRKGFAWQLRTKRLLNMEKAEQILILKPDVSDLFMSEFDCDVEVGKSLASVIASEQWNKNPSKIIAEFHDEKTGFMYLQYCQKNIVDQIRLNPKFEDPEIISSSKLKDNILAQCINTPDLTEIYDNLFGFSGSEIYFADPESENYKALLPKFLGKNIQELNYHFDNIIIIGFYLFDNRHRPSRNKIFINPDSKFPFSENNGLICIAQNEKKLKQELSKQINELPINITKVKKINLIDDNISKKINIFDLSDVNDGSYLKKMLQSIIEHNYFRNIDKIKILQKEKQNEIDNLDLPNLLDIEEFDEGKKNHSVLGIIIHHLKTDLNGHYNFQIYSIDENSILKRYLNAGDIILNILPSTNDESHNKILSLEENYFKFSSERMLQKYLIKILNEQEKIDIIYQEIRSKSLKKITLLSREVLKIKLEINKKNKNEALNIINNDNHVKANIDLIAQDNLEMIKNSDFSDLEKYDDSNVYIFLNETTQKIQKFRDNPIEDHPLINSFIKFSSIDPESNIEQKKSMITEINGYRTKRILENYKNNYYSNYLGNDVIEMNSIISKYIAASTFDIKIADLIQLLFNNMYLIKAYSLNDKQLDISFTELEQFFHLKDETLIGYIDYDFDTQGGRKINHVAINPNQKTILNLDYGDRLITIAKYSKVNLINNCNFLYFL